MSANELGIPISKMRVIGLRNASHNGMARGRKIPDRTIKIDTTVNSTHPMIHKLSSIPPCFMIATIGDDKLTAPVIIEDRIVIQVTPCMTAPTMANPIPPNKMIAAVILAVGRNTRAITAYPNA